MNDPASDALASFYAAYRGTVRAKVSCLRADEEDDAAERETAFRAADEWMRSAASHLAEVHAPLLIVFCGLSGTGKSTIARAVAERIGAVRISTDIVRKELHGYEPQDRPPSETLYTKATDEVTYRTLRERGRERLSAGVSVVLDATFQREDDRTAALQIAERAGVGALLVQCVCPPEVARDRIEARRRAGRDPSDADLAVFENQRRHFESPEEVPAAQLLRLDTSPPVDTSVERVVGRLREMLQAVENGP